MQTLKQKIEAQIKIYENWKDTTYEEEVIECCNYSINLLKEIIKEVYAE